jgi:hypothetical protein
MARTSRTTAKSKTVVKVNFEGVEASGNLAEGRYLFTVEGVPEIKTSETSGNDYINWVFKTDGGKVWHITSLAPQALFNLRNTLEALGVEVEETVMNLDLTEYEGLTCGGEVEHEVYGGKKRARLIDIFPESELDGDENDDAADNAKDVTPKGKAGSSKKAEPEPEEEELTYADIADASKEDLLELAKENDVEGITLKMKKDLEALRAHIAAALELEAPEEEQEEESGGDPTYASLQAMDKEGLLALVKENEIEGVTLKMKKDLAALRNHVCEAFELEAEEEEKTEAPKTRRKVSGSKELAVGSKVKFVDDGDDVEGVVKEINTKQKFAKVEVDGDEWEVELTDLTVL